MRIFMPVLLLLILIEVKAQNIFSEGEFDYNKPFAPYELQNTFGLPYNEFMLLSEYKKGEFKLSLMDQYFIDKWSKIIDFGKEGSFPKLLQLGDEALIFRWWKDRGQAVAEVQRFDTKTGEKTGEFRQVVFDSDVNINSVQIKFAASKSQFVVLNPSNGSANLDVYSTTKLEKTHSYPFDDFVAFGKTYSLFLNDDGSLLLASGDANTFSLDLYFYQNKNGNEPVKLTSNFSFARPAGSFSSIEIVKQSASTYFVQTSANIEDELVGINISSFNVVLKSLLFSNTFNIDKAFIKSCYEKSVFTSPNQKKKYITTPDTFSKVDVQELFIDENGNITTILEMQDLPSTYHKLESGLNFGIKWKEPEEKYMDSEDLILLNYDAEGTINWKRVIQKTQIDMGRGLTLSYLANLTSDNSLQLIMKESAKGNSVYYFKIDLENGEIIDKQSFIDKNVNINKNYSSWIDDNILLLCGHPIGSKKRSFYLVEF